MTYLAIFDIFVVDCDCGLCRPKNTMGRNFDNLSISAANLAIYAKPNERTCMSHATELFFDFLRSR